MEVTRISKTDTKWFLESTSDAEAKLVFPIEPLPFTIGRNKDCNLVLQSKWASMYHAQIHLSGRMLWVRDFGSTNGTFLNYKKIEEAEFIEIGDIITFGNIEFRICSGESVLADSIDETVAFDSTMDQVGQAFYYRPQLLKLIQERAVIPHFQPIRKFSDSSVVGYEILGRISGDDLPSSPAELLDIAAQLDCVIELSSLFREEGVRLGSRLGGSPQLFINTHPMELYQMDGLEQSLRKIREGAPSAPIILEISEKAVTQSDQVNRLRITLKDLNIGLAYDDFGVGQTRLVELAELPPNFLKFDMSIICNIHLAPNRLHQMVVTFIKAARDLGIETIAEGIACKNESEKCKHLGFEYAQGFLYGKPLPIGQVRDATVQTTP